MSVQPGDRVQHLCKDPTCFLRGTVTLVTVLPEPTIWVKWDPFQGIDQSITADTPALPIKPEKISKIA